MRAITLAGALTAAPFARAVHLAPDSAVLLFTAGLCLVFLEFNRPGLILPGAAGLLCVLLAAAALSQYPVQWQALVLLLLAVAPLLANLLYKLPFWLLALATLAIAAGLRLLLPATGTQTVHTPVACGCGILLGALGAGLSRIALRARRAKQVN